jgi:DNA-binding MurR/RpiR family transcriptional regulator
LSGSVVIAEDAAFKFERLGIDCQVYDTVHSQILSATI